MDGGVLTTFEALAAVMVTSFAAIYWCIRESSLENAPYIATYINIDKARTRLKDLDETQART